MENRISYYTLDERGQVVGTPDVIAWAQWFEANPDKRIVGRTHTSDAEVSTVFLGVDHNFFGGPPLLFETMIFGGEYDQHQWRHSTKAEAIDVHAAIVGALLKGENPDAAVQS